MNSIISNRIAPSLRLLYQARTAGYWNKDWKPGPYPETPEERKAAAKKYNLLPEEYKPYTPGNGYLEPGDYPNVPAISNENKDIYYPWDMPDERRNFGEPLHVDAVWFGEQRYDSHAPQKYKYTALQMFLAMAGAVAFLFALDLDPLICFPPVAKRQFPRPGVINYTYEPAD